MNVTGVQTCALPILGLDTRTLEVSYHLKAAVPVACVVLALCAPVLSFLLARAGGFVGVLLEGVAPGSPAEQAGLKAGDRIIAVMGQRIRNIEELTSLYDKMEPGKPVEFTIIREGKELKLQVTPAAP